MRLSIYGEECLRKRSVPIEEVTDETKKDAYEMLDFAIKLECYGLAYPQMGKNLRLFVVNPQIVPEGYNAVFVNPEIRQFSVEMTLSEEGCMSFLGGELSNIERFRDVTVHYKDLAGEEYKLKTGPPLSVVIQHEMDHLDGKLIIDNVSRLQKNLLLRRFKKLKKRMGDIYD